ncbi:hypothetical protein L21SP2_0332 [Salinispira pacifica]|uniref:Uncharacterized protein n=1 Tax=Salinispira pacifica TaxID=1307761 RepID=V5WDS5_9SPIO|nr:hypothetical protein L21SP2_0332 [Salinispira pacifica]
MGLWVYLKYYDFPPAQQGFFPLKTGASATSHKCKHGRQTPDGTSPGRGKKKDRHIALDAPAHHRISAAASRISRNHPGRNGYFFFFFFL